MKHLMAVCLMVLSVALVSTSSVLGAVNDGPSPKLVWYEGDLSGTWTGSFEANGRWDYTMTLTKASADKFNGTIVWKFNGTKLDPPDSVVIEITAAGKLQMTWRKDTVDGTFTKDKMIVNGVNGPMTFTRQP